jgi:hypothetical protein
MDVNLCLLLVCFQVVIMSIDVEVDAVDLEWTKLIIKRFFCIWRLILWLLPSNLRACCLVRRGLRGICYFALLKNIYFALYWKGSKQRRRVCHMLLAVKKENKLCTVQPSSV